MSFTPSFEKDIAKRTKIESEKHKEAKNKIKMEKGVFVLATTYLCSLLVRILVKRVLVSNQLRSVYMIPGTL